MQTFTLPFGFEGPLIMHGRYESDCWFTCSTFSMHKKDLHSAFNPTKRFGKQFPSSTARTDYGDNRPVHAWFRGVCRGNKQRFSKWFTVFGLSSKESSLVRDSRRKSIRRSNWRRHSHLVWLQDTAFADMRERHYGRILINDRKKANVLHSILLMSLNEIPWKLFLIRLQYIQHLPAGRPILATHPPQMHGRILGINWQKMMCTDMLKKCDI